MSDQAQSGFDLPIRRPRVVTAGLNGSVNTFVTCPKCGALLADHSPDGTDAILLHATWHGQLEARLAELEDFEARLREAEDR